MYLDELLLNCGQSGPKVCKSCRSLQELSNESLLAKISFDTAKKDLSEVSYKGHNLQGKLLHIDLTYSPDCSCSEMQ